MQTSTNHGIVYNYTYQVKYYKFLISDNPNRRGSEVQLTILNLE